MSIYNYPRCAAYLKGMRVKLNDPEMNDYWFAVILADALRTDELEKAGVRFGAGGPDTHTLLGMLEGILANRKSFTERASESLKAFIGARGVKPSKLKTIQDYWKVAGILWPQHFRGKIGTLDQLEKQIRSLSKKQRQEARLNISNVPAELRASF